MTRDARKILIIGVGNGGTRLLGRIIHRILGEDRYPYHYEPLYWNGEHGESGIAIDHERIAEHVRFPLCPEQGVQWEWMVSFVGQLDGLAKFIRAGSRASCFVQLPVKIVWVTRELYNYLGSMQKNFPRCLPEKGWHHRPGHYDDFSRLTRIYSSFDLKPEEDFRVEVEAAWWHLHNAAMLRYIDRPNVIRVRYEDLCSDPVHEIGRVAEFLDLDCAPEVCVEQVRDAPSRTVTLTPRNTWMIEAIAGDLNRSIYAGSTVDPVARK